MTELQCDVVIIGAGATGLTIATDLQKAGLSAIVVEARDRVGGRLRTETVDGAVLELGGQWVSPDQQALIAMLDELGLETFARFRDGESVYVDDTGSATRFTGDLFPTSEETQNEIERLIALLSALTAEVDPSEPWNHPRATELDAESFEAWLERNSADAEARANVALFVAEAMLTKPAHSFSVLQALLMASSAGGFGHLVDADFILDRRVVGGLQRVPVLLAERLGDGLHLSQPARSVEYADDGVVVTTDDLVVRARRAVVAVPPNLYGRIGFSPALPPVRQQMHQHLSLGLVIKVHAVYPTPFWRDAGLSGTAFSPFQVAHEAYDNSGHGEGTGTLVAFVAGETADRMLALTAAERERTILESLAAYFGDEALSPTVYFESDWVSEEWTGGAYAASFDLGGLVRWGAHLRSPVGPIRFASSDIAGEGYQHVDGAIRIGHEVAAELARDLRGAGL
ncbi:NAD(P)/FAD-dependent oxidoreductase [Conyzicola nivalis]|uniref:Putrescine oxidase n=1 Tax=Conyzicola nivalis TaxID=1477021 RepID=A0A916SL19_9MICO|nr:NAD(P)/FAD-dependent oxidoreductase [Conyzicola nivalis]GGB01596.1 putative putrescine oxidase [Conyzicola nivalis]